MTAFDFRKSSHSGGEPHAECVEVAVNVPGTIAIRDSKDPDPDAPILRLAPATWASFTASLH
ncbi:DUF397 domain-containing protein [Streptomyces sp. NPDC058268]|uniref:DUF397 domain-containing protein n=1 Tax=Streptomyces sp. NPDC058268 TaxID=3346413 RepID=UPI0036E43842